MSDMMRIWAYGIAFRVYASAELLNPHSFSLLQVDLARRRSFPVYWQAGERRVLRGLWFGQGPGAGHWLPIREDLAEQLEAAYRYRVSGGMEADKWCQATPMMGIDEIVLGLNVGL